MPSSLGNYPGPHNAPPTASFDERVRRQAYLLWEAAGCPSGDGVDFWIQAEQIERARDASGLASSAPPLPAPQPHEDSSPVPPPVEAFEASFDHPPILEEVAATPLDLTPPEAAEIQPTAHPESHTPILSAPPGAAPPAPDVDEPPTAFVHDIPEPPSDERAVSSAEPPPGSPAGPQSASPPLASKEFAPAAQSELAAAPSKSKRSKKEKAESSSKKKAAKKADAEAASPSADPEARPKKASKKSKESGPSLDDAKSKSKASKAKSDSDASKKKPAKRPKKKDD